MFQVSLLYFLSALIVVPGKRARGGAFGFMVRLRLVSDISSMMACIIVCNQEEPGLAILRLTLIWPKPE